MYNYYFYKKYTIYTIDHKKYIMYVRKGIKQHYWGCVNKKPPIIVALNSTCILLI